MKQPLEPGRTAPPASAATGNLRRVVIVGAGVSGLCAGYLLQRARPDIELRVLEAGERAGGVVHSERTPEGCLLETGPDSLITWKPQTVALIEQLGMQDELVTQGPAPRRALVKLEHRLAPLPEGLQGTLPAAPLAVLRSSLFSWQGKLRIACEPLIPKRRTEQDESVGAFVSRRFGAQALDRLVAPLLGGIYACDPDTLSAAAVLSTYVQQEQRYGSIARALRHTRRLALPAGSLPAATALPPVVSLRDGMGSLPAHLQSALGDKLQLGAAAVSVLRNAHGQLQVTTARNEVIVCDAVILACPPAPAARLLAELAPAAARELEAIESSDVLHVQLTFPASACTRAPAATGFVVAPSAHSALSACTFSSRKWAQGAPDSLLSFRCFLRDPQLGDTRAVDEAVRCLTQDLQLTAAPSHVHVTRLRAALPRYQVGHLERVERIARSLEPHADVALTGNAYLGPGIADCIRSAQRAVDQIVCLAT